ncbi:uncharacterized protein [Watersipora subatra]|uniref:uncharacterized protein n=1 Tax=Watersipora subatra TaxID=2589382 RepID=UPI00355BEE20
MVQKSGNHSPDRRPYHPATNGAAERLVQSFKQALKKLDLSAQSALQEFLMMYRRTPLSYGYSPIGTPCYALYCGPKRDKRPKWVEAVVIKVFGSRTVNVRVLPRGPTWKRHLEQLCPRHALPEDAEPPVEIPTTPSSLPQSQQLPTAAAPKPKRRNPRLPDGNEYNRDNSRRSKRQANR